MNRYFIAKEYETFLKEYEEKLKAAQVKLEAELEEAPQGALKIVCKKSYTQFYYRKTPGDIEGTYIPKKEARLLVEPVLLEPELLAQKWQTVEYERLPFDKTDTQFFTSRDE